MPLTSYDKLVEFRESSLTEAPLFPWQTQRIGDTETTGQQAARLFNKPGGGQPGAAPAQGAATSPPQGKLDLNALLKAGKAYAIVYKGQYHSVIFYNEAKRGWSVAVNRNGSWTVSGDAPQSTLSKAFAQASLGF